MCRLYDRFGKFDGFRMYHALSLNDNSKIINVVKRQRNLGLGTSLICQFSLTHSIISKLNFINGERSREFQQPEINKNCTGTPTTSTIGNIKPHFKPDYFILIHYIIVMIGTHESISQHFQETW